MIIGTYIPLSIKKKIKFRGTIITLYLHRAITWSIVIIMCHNLHNINNSVKAIREKEKKKNLDKLRSTMSDKNKQRQLWRKRIIKWHMSYTCDSYHQVQELCLLGISLLPPPCCSCHQHPLLGQHSPLYHNWSPCFWPLSDPVHSLPSYQNSLSEIKPWSYYFQLRNLPWLLTVHRIKSRFFSKTIKRFASKPSSTSSVSALGNCSPHTSSPPPSHMFHSSHGRGPLGSPTALLLTVSPSAVEAECLEAWILEPKDLGPFLSVFPLRSVTLEKFHNFFVPILSICKMRI